PPRPRSRKRWSARATPRKRRSAASWPACCGSGKRRSPPTRPTAWPWRSRTSCGRDRPGRRSPRRQAGGSRDDPHGGRRRLRNRRPAGRDGAPPRGGRDGHPRHRAGGARGRLVAVRVPGRRRAPLLPAADRGERRGTEDRDRVDVRAGGGAWGAIAIFGPTRSEEHTSELQSRENLVCRLLLEKKKKKTDTK